MKYQPQERKIKTITITLTQSCNLKCSYCYENNKSPKIMTFNTAQQIIDKELQNKDKYTGFEIDLFGGEPFLQFELIKQITNYACQKLNDFPHTIFLTTNGTLVHGDVQKWLIDHKDCVICGLSLDGTREMHNTNRSNSFDSIDIDFFAENYPMQDIKMTISRETLPTMADINEAYETLSNPQSRKEYDQQYSRFINSTKSCEKKVSGNDAGSQLNKTTTSEKSSNEPDSRHGFFSFVKKVGSAIVEDYTQTCERRNREIENAYIRAQRLPDDRLIYCFRTSGGAEKIGYARELEHRDYLYLDSNGVYQATYKYKNFRY